MRTASPNIRLLLLCIQYPPRTIRSATCKYSTIATLWLPAVTTRTSIVVPARPSAVSRLLARRRARIGRAIAQSVRMRVCGRCSIILPPVICNSLCIEQNPPWLCGAVHDRAKSGTFNGWFYCATNLNVHG